MIYFLFGEYGSGKSTYITEQIKANYENGIRSFLVVPEQQTVVSERQIATLLPPKAQLYTEVLNFTRMANKVFRDLGGLRYNTISRNGKSLIMYRAICECRKSLEEYTIIEGHEKGCISLFLQTIGELKFYSVDIPMLEGIVDKLDNPRLRGRIRDVIKIWTVYERILNERFSDPYDDVLILAKKLEEYDYFKDTNVYFDSFYGFTKSQLDVIVNIITSCDNIYFAFDCPKGIKVGDLQYAKIAQSVEKLRKLCKSLGEEITEIEFTNDYKHNSEAIKFLSTHLWDFSAEAISCSDDVSLALCGDEFQESEFVASKISSLIMQGCKYSNIAIIARNTESYRGVLDYTLKKYGIPHFFSTPSELLTRPVVKMIFNALSAITSYRAEDVISYVKCGYTDIDLEALGDFESYIYRWNIYGKKFKSDEYFASNPEGFFEMKPENEAVLKRVLSVRDEIISKLSILEEAFVSSKNVSECTTAIFEFLKAHNVLEKLENEKRTSERADAYIIVQVWQAILDALDTIVNICGDSIVSPATYSTLLMYALTGAKVGSIPTGEDNVIIADAHVIRAENIKHVFIIGANEGVFPANIVDDTFFTDSDKDELQRVGIELSSKTDVRGDDELLYFKNSIAIASDTVTISALSAGIDGKEKAKSIAFNRVESLFKGIKIESFSSYKLVDKIYTPSLAREYFAMADSELKKSITSLTGFKCDFNNTFENDRDVLKEKTTRSVYNKKDLYLSQSMLDSFRRCRFSYYSKYMLKLRSNQKISFSSREVGILVHAVFEHFLTILRDEKNIFDKLDTRMIRESVDSVTEAYVATISDNRFKNNRLKHLFDRLKSNMYIFVERMVEEFKQCDFVPEYFELKFSDDGISSPPFMKIKLSDGTYATVHGIADRVDTYRTEDKTYIRVVDYKTGEESFSLNEFYRGGKLQLPIYLFSLCNMKDCEFRNKLLKGTKEILPAGFFYLPLGIGRAKINENIDFDSSASESKERAAVLSNLKVSGRFLDDEAILLAQDKSGENKYIPKKTNSKDPLSSPVISLEGFEQMYDILCQSIDNIAIAMKGGDASAIPSQPVNCDWCEFKPFCRRR